MIEPTVYIETTVVSYLTAWPSKDVVRQGHQELTRRWWDERRSSFDLFTSQFVLDECAAGDPGAAAERLSVLQAVDLLAIPDGVIALADALLREGALPAKARLDALHLAVATLNGLQYLLNCSSEIRHEARRDRGRSPSDARGDCDSLRRRFAGDL